jgi:hypothetical protein
LGIRGFLEVCDCVLLIEEFVVLMSEGGLLHSQLFDATFMLGDGFKQAFCSLFVAEELGSEQLRFGDGSFGPDEAEGGLHLRVVADERVHLAL